jgi:hypothetical protein
VGELFGVLRIVRRKHAPRPAVRKSGETFLANLDAITVEQMCETAEKTHVLDDEKVSGDFAI